MDYETRIKTAAAYRGITQGQLAERIGMTPQNFNKKLKRKTFTPEEMDRIAEALSAEYKCYFEFPDGTRI